MAPRRHMSYTAAFKMKVIERAEIIGNRAAGREFIVDERCIRRWRSEKSELSKMPKSKRARRSGTVKFPELENDLEKWILEQREKGLSISTVKIRLQAKIIAANLAIPNFKGTPNWCFRFMSRKKLSVRSRTTVGQCLPHDWEKKKSSFLMHIKNIIEEKKLKPSQIINMDEVPLTFDCPPNRTVCKTGDKSVPIVTTGNERTSFTCVLACAANGEKLKPMIIFKRKTQPKENFPKDVIIRCNEKGWMCETLMIDWLNEVWRKRSGSFFQPSGVLIFDSMRAHLMESVKVEARRSSAFLSVIPGGLTKILQPLDLTVNCCFKKNVRKHWEQWMTSGQHSYTKGGNMRKASYEEVAKWVSEAWKEIPLSIIQSGFSRANIISTPENGKPDESSSDESGEEAELNDEFLLDCFHSESETSDFEGFQ